MTGLSFGKWETTGAVFLGLGAFQLAEVWHNSAPTLAELRNADPLETVVRQQLMDADYTVGTLAVAVGLIITLLTHDITPLLVLLALFGILSIWSHQVLAAPSHVVGK